MKLTTTKTNELKFTVGAFWPEEGGMGSDSYGESMDSLEEAVECLELARKHDTKIEWVIVVKVKTVIK